MSQPYIMISLQTRRDLHDPLRFFRKLQIHHLYREALWGKVASDNDAETFRFGTPLSLSSHLTRFETGIVQGIEPFALLPLPFIVQILRHVKRYDLPLVIPSLENIPFEQKYGSAVTALAAPLLRRYIAQATMLIPINEGARQNFLRFGASPDKIVRLMYGCWGVDVEEFSPIGPVAELPPCGDAPVILFVGRMVAAKGVFVLIDAFERLRVAHPDLRLVFAGAGKDEQHARELVQAKGLDGVAYFLGSVDNTKMPALLRRATLLAAPSLSTPRWAEQVGMVLLQAMACGTPVVSTLSGSVPEFVEHNETGLLVAENDVAALVDAMQKVIDNSDIATRLRTNALAYVAEHYDASKNVAIAEEAILRRCAQ